MLTHSMHKHVKLLLIYNSLENIYFLIGIILIVYNS